MSLPPERLQTRLARLRAWLSRPPVVPPGQVRKLPTLLRLPRDLLARELGIVHPADAGEWLLRLFVLPADDHPAGANYRHLVGYGPKLLRALLRALGQILGWPLRLVEALLDRLDFAPAERASQAATAAYARLPAPLAVLLMVIASVLLWICATTPLSWQQQSIFFVLIWLMAMTVRRVPGNLTTMLLAALSLVASGRYIWWRLTETLDLQTPADLFFGYGLILAEAYTWLIMLLGYFQNAWPLQRTPVPMPADTSLWPAVDIYIPTYNEPLSVVKTTIYASLGLDWPADKLKIYVLDDGRRAEFRDFAAEVGAEYMIRPDNFHAKAGNLNHALTKTQGEYIAIFDCDHVPVRSFLQMTVGLLLQDPKCAMVQTPHHFFSPDPFERNLGTFRRVPSEASLFYGLVQDGNDLWNATFFCGSCAVIKRGPLQEVGGIAVETVTEDAHTALKMQRLGYNTAYLNLTQAAGLSTESLSGHVGQRIRWARGMAQIFRIDNPFTGPGLSLFQRLCYSNAMLHFFNGIPRLIFLTAPLSYLLFGLHVINAASVTIAAYALPHLCMSQLANARMQGRYRHSFWAEVYETVLAWYITLPTTVAFFNPGFGKFNVTAKGGLIEKEYFDWSISRPYLVLIAINFLGVVIGVLRLLYWNTFETGTVLMNLAWAIYNLVMLGTALGVAAESRQVRRNHRVPLHTPATLQLHDGRTIHCRTSDYSSGGLGLKLPAAMALERDQRVRISLSRGDREFSFPAYIADGAATRVGLRFQNLTREEEKLLVQCTFGRADAWINWDEPQATDKPLSSLGEVLAFGLSGYTQLFRQTAARFAARRRAPAAADL